MWNDQCVLVWVVDMDGEVVGYQCGGVGGECDWCFDCGVQVYFCVVGGGWFG